VIGRLEILSVQRGLQHTGNRWWNHVVESSAIA
jgi:hypothetical protein